MDRWSQLSMSEKSDLMSLYIRNGISSLEEIKKHYNSFADGGELYLEGDDPDLTPLNLSKMYANNTKYGDNRYIDTTMLREIDNYMISKKVGLPQRQAIAYTVQQEGNTTGSHGNGATGLVGWRGPRTANLSKTTKGQAAKLYDEVYGTFNADNWNHGGKGSGYKSGKAAQQAFKNATTATEAAKALNYGYVRPPLADRVSRTSNVEKMFKSTGGHLYQDEGPDKPNFVGGATALKKDYNYELEHLADKYAVTAEGPWHDYGIHNPSISQKTHWNELSEMYNRVAQRPNYEYLNPINIAEYSPIVGDAIDAGRSMYDLQQGNIGVGLAGLGLLALPNFIEKPLKLGTKVLKFPVQAIKNIKANRNINSQNEILETVWNNLLERESRDAGVYRHSRAEKELTNSNPNMFYALPNEIHYPKINQSANIIRYMYNGNIPKTLKEVTEGFKEGVHNLFNTNAYNLNDVIYVNPINWATGPTDFKGLLGHEVQHSVQRTLPSPHRLSMDNPNYEYYINNTENKHTRDLLKPFERKSGKWEGSPEELDSEIIKWKLLNNIDLKTDFSEFSPEMKQLFVDKVMKRFDLQDWEATNILNGLSRNQYFDLGGYLDEYSTSTIDQ